MEGIDGMSDHQHGHIPFVLLLLHYLDEWKAGHGGRAPENYKEKSEFRELVRRGARTGSAEGEEENYEEAVGAVLKSLNPPALSTAVKEVLEAQECKNLTKEVRLSVVQSTPSLAYFPPSNDTDPPFPSSPQTSGSSLPPSHPPTESPVLPP